jgi:hypothetical protein
MANGDSGGDRATTRETSVLFPTILQNSGFLQYHRLNGKFRGSVLL